MMRFVAFSVAVGLAVVGGVSVAADPTPRPAFISTDTLRGWLDKPDIAKRTIKDHIEFSQGIGYVAGIADVYQGEHAHICIPDGVRMGQLAAVVQKYIAVHPDQWHHAAGGTVRSALAETWPCTRP